MFYLQDRKYDNVTAVSSVHERIARRAGAKAELVSDLYALSEARILYEGLALVAMDAAGVLHGGGRSLKEVAAAKGVLQVLQDEVARVMQLQRGRIAEAEARVKRHGV